MIPPRAVALALTLILGACQAACGESDEEKAQNQVCDARDKIRSEVDKLENLTLTTATVDQVKSSLDAIREHLGEISDAQGQLDNTRKQQVEQANQTFKSQVNRLADDLGQSTSLEDAAKQLESDFGDLAAVYKESFAPIDCD
jgi:Zn-dependent oligopeptidase